MLTPPARQTPDRLGVFADVQIDDVRARMGVIAAPAWPSIEGCLAVLFTSRSGSTFLARELECVFDIGRMREALNPGQVKRRAAVIESRGAWFAFKAGVPGVIAGEFSGFFDAYLASTAFILLARRDIVSQAVSCVKAKQTGQFHSTQKAEQPAVYDELKIAQFISIIANCVEKLRRYVEKSERPWRLLFYEDFAQSDFSEAIAACESLGVPRRPVGSRIRSMPVERIGDAINAAWVARFTDGMDAATREIIERYAATL